MLDLIGVILGLTGNAFIICTNPKLRLIGFGIWAISDVALVLWSPSQAVAIMYIIYGMLAIVGMVVILKPKKTALDFQVFGETNSMEVFLSEMDKEFKFEKD